MENKKIDLSVVITFAVLATWCGVVIGGIIGWHLGLGGVQ